MAQLMIVLLSLHEYSYFWLGIFFSVVGNVPANGEMTIW